MILQIFLNKFINMVMGGFLIETGLIFINELFKFKLLDDLYLFKTDKNLEHNGYNNSSVDFIKKIKLKKA